MVVMERYIIFSVETGQLLHKKEFLGSKDAIGLAMQLSALMQVADCQIKVLQGEVLTCFSKDANSPLAIAAEFTPGFCTSEQGQGVTSSILETYLQMNGSIVRTRNKLSNTKEFDQSLTGIFKTLVQNTLRELVLDLEVSKLLVLVKKSARKQTNLTEERRSEFFSGITSAYSSISAESSFIESRSFRSYSVDPKMKYSFRPETKATPIPEERKVMPFSLAEHPTFDQSQAKALLELCRSAEQILTDDSPEKIDLCLPCGDVKVLLFKGVKVMLLSLAGSLRTDWATKMEQLERWTAIVFAISYK